MHAGFSRQCGRVRGRASGGGRKDGRDRRARATSPRIAVATLLSAGFRAREGAAVCSTLTLWYSYACCAAVGAAASRRTSVLAFRTLAIRMGRSLF
jgi:hypothetical protein